jgi:ribosomal protein L9
MLKMTEKMFRTEDGVAVELTQKEIEEVLQMRQEAAQLQAQRKAEAEARATQKAALLDRLGITEDEARLLLG